MSFPTEQPHQNPELAMNSLKLITAILFLGTLFYTAQWAFMDLYPLVVINGVLSLIYLSILYPIYKKKLNLAAYACISIALLHFSFYANFAFNYQSGFHVFLIAIIPSVFLLLPHAPRWHHLFVALIVAILMSISAIDWFEVSLYTYPEHYRLFSYSIIGVFLVITLNLSVVVCNRSIDSYQAKLTHLAQTDELTQLYNRRFFLSHIHQAIDNLEQHDYYLMTLDLDYFKSVNDTFGHMAGDAALVAVATTIKGMILEPGAAARLGGEEFAVLCPCTDKEQALEKAEAIRSAIEQRKIVNQDEVIQCTVSIGVAQLSHDYSLTLKQSDQALYQAKNAGRNCVMCYDETENSHIHNCEPV